MYEEDHAASGTVVGVTKYYEMSGRTVAVRNVTDASGMQTGTLDYLLHDQLGSAVGTLASDGSIASTASYWPYGALRNFTVGLIVETDKLYTGQRAEWGDATLGLYNYHARFYSTTLGAFVSADAVGDGLNRYAYVHGNPLRYTDPTGHTCAPVMPGLGSGAGDPGDCYADPAKGSNDAGAPCGALCVALEQLAARGIYSPEELEYRAALQFCAANPAACGGGPAAPVASSLPVCPGPSCGYPLPGDGASWAETLGIATAAARLLGAEVAVPLGLAALGLVASPCDTQYCTQKYATPPKQLPAFPGAERVKPKG
ncbi:MAG TPA: RHS repeat-associated core domain-containing protein, partial [Dehalococcoidia bacterium]|nr:RHS repeat-associated core domain-containing protein [Dehalococcoidia bacterium]